MKKKEHLPLTGVEPIYVAIIIACTVAGIAAARTEFFQGGRIDGSNNLWLMVLPVVYWAFMTVLMKNTEEKWLKDLYGAEYVEYCRRVNRCIPWKRGNK